MTAPPLVAVAHGSRDPRSAATVAALVAEVRRQRPDLDIRLSFLDLSAPRLADVLCAVHAEGHRRAVVVPLLLGHAFHARVDVPGAVGHAMARHPGLLPDRIVREARAAGAAVSAPLGADAGVASLVVDRYTAAADAAPAARALAS